MSKIFKSSDIFNEVISSASGLSKRSVNPEKEQQLLYFCDLIDQLIVSIEGSSFELQIDENTGEITMIISSMDLTTRRGDIIFPQLIANASKISFKCDNLSDEVKTELTFNGIWDKIGSV